MLMAKKWSFYETNWSFVLACQLIGRGDSAALRLKKILNLGKPVTKNLWLSQMTTLCNVAEEVTEALLK